MNEILCSLGCSFLIASSALMQYSPFYRTNNKTINKKINIFLICLFVVLSIFSYVFLQFHEINIFIYKVYLLSSTVVIFIVLLFMLKKNVKAHLFSYGIVNIVLVYSTMLGGYLAQFINTDNFTQKIIITNSVAIILVYASAFFLDKFLYDSVRSLIYMDDKNAWKNIYIIPILTALITLFTNPLSTHVTDLYSVISKLLICALGLFACGYYANVYLNKSTRIAELEGMLSFIGSGLFTAVETKNNFEVILTDNALEILGIEKSESKKVTFDNWYNRIVPEYLETIKNAYNSLLENSRSEVYYSWNHPTKGNIFLRMRLILETNSDERKVIYGYVESINNTVIIRKNTDSEEIIDAILATYFATLYIDLKRNSFEVYNEKFSTLGLSKIDGNLNELFTNLCSYVADDNIEGFKDFVNLETLNERLAGKNIIDYEYYSKKQNKWFRAVFIPTNFYSNGKIKKLIYAITEIGDSKEKELESKKVLEDAFYIAEKANGAKTSFLSRMSHDIRTPMNVVLGMTDIALMNIDDKQKVIESLDNIKISGQYLLDLINEVLDINKIESGKIEKTNRSFNFIEMLKLVHTISTAKANQKNQKIVLNYDNLYNYNVFGDDIHIQQILLNIIDNSLKYSSEDSVVTVEITEKKTNIRSIHEYEIMIKDNGIGMSKDFLKHIFEPFSREETTTRKNVQGTGLGMAIVNSYIKMIGGTIKIESEKGIGSAFILNIPLQVEGKQVNFVLEKAKEKQVDTNIDYGKICVLCVDDNDINLCIIKEFLKIIGVVVETASNGKQAVDMLSKNEPNHYQIVFMDVQMPVMNGLEASKTIRNLNRADLKEIPIIALTANAFLDDIEAAHNAGMNEHISKPVKLEKIKEVIDKYVEK